MEATGVIDGYDSTIISNIPRDAGAVVCYSDRRFRNDGEARAQFPHLVIEGRIIALAAVTEPPNSDLAGDGVDTEPGNVGPAGAAQSLKARIRAGHWRPVGYADLSDMRTLISDLHLIGIPTPPPGPRRLVRLYSAHPTGIKHICGPATCGFPIEMDGTQWWWSSLQNPGGPDLDKNVFRDDFFRTASPRPPTRPPIPKDTMTLVVGHNTDGRQELFVQLQSGEVKHIAQATPNGDWWKDKAGNFQWISLGNPGK